MPGTNDIVINLKTNGIQQAKNDFNSVGAEAKKMASDMDAVGQSVGRVRDATKGITPDNFNRCSDAAKQLRNDLDSIQNRGNSATLIGSGVIDTKPLTASTKSLNSELDKTTTTASKASSSLREVGNEAQKSGAKANSSKSGFASLISSLTRIAKLRFLRGIIRSITQGISEGTQNFYQYSAAMGNADPSHFKGTMDSLATTFLQVKNAIGSVVAPLLSSLLPAIQTVAGWFITAANAVAQFFAVLNGQKTYTKAKQSATAWKQVEAGASGAAAAAQEYKNTILGFDEIHALNDVPTSGGGGSGGGSTGPDFSDMFEEAPLATDGIIGAFNKLASLLRPILQEIGNFVQGWVEGVVTFLDGGVTAITGFLNHNKEQFYQGMDEIQSVFIKNGFFRTIAEFFYNAYRAVATFFRDIKGWAIDAAIWIVDAFDFLDPVLEKLGLPTIGQGRENLMKLKEDNEKAKVAIDECADAYISWLNGDITSEQLTKEIERIGMESDNARPKIEKNKKKMEEWWGTTNNKKLLTSIKDVSKIAKNAKDDIENAKKKADGFFGIDVGGFSIKKGIEKIIDKAKEAAKGFKNAQDSADKFGKHDPNTSVIQSAISRVTTTANEATSAENKIKTTATEVGKSNPETTTLQNALGRITGSAGGASGAIWGIKDNATYVGSMNPSFYNINTSFGNLYWYATNTADAVGRIKTNINQLNGSTIHISTSGSVFGGGSLGNFAEGGFVDGYAKGGIVIPRFDGGGIHSANLFAAHENGIPELVGRIGNRPAVANQGQMVDAMAMGVYRAMSEAMATSNGQTEVNVYMNGERIARAVDQANRMQNRRFNVQAV